MVNQATVYDPQLGNVPADASKIIYLDEDKKLEGPQQEFIVVVDRFTNGGKCTQIITRGRFNIIHEACVDRNFRWDNHILTVSHVPFLTEEEKKILVEANKYKIYIKEDKYGTKHVETIDGKPFTYELAEECCEYANRFIRERAKNG